MPSLGSILKKKRTKDSAKDPTSPTSPTLEKKSTFPPTSPNQSNQTNQSSSTQSSQPVGTQSTASVPPEIPANANGAMAPTSSHHAKTESSASIKNLINPPQSDGAGAAIMEPIQPRQTKGKYTLTDFALQRTLGTGSFGRVHLVQSKHNQRFYAVKVLKKAQVVKMKQIEHTNDERKMLGRVKHPFLITLWGTFQDSKNLYMVMDFIEGGELFSLLRKSQVSSASSKAPEFWSNR